MAEWNFVSAMGDYLTVYRIGSTYSKQNGVTEAAKAPASSGCLSPVP